MLVVAGLILGQIKNFFLVEMFAICKPFSTFKTVLS